MISWIQTTFQHHFRKIFLALLVVVIISFVFAINQSSGLGSAEQETRQITLFGRSLTSSADKATFESEGRISYILHRGADGADPQSHNLGRAAALAIADQLGVPQPTEAQQVEFIKSLPFFASPEGRYDPQQYVRFIDSLKANPYFTEAQVSKVLIEDWRVAQVKRAIGGPGYVSDAEVQEQLSIADTAWSAQEAIVDLAKVPAPAEPTEEQLKRFFDDNTFRYKIPAQTRVSYIEFSAASYLDAARRQITEQEITRYFEDNKSRYRPDTPPPKPGEPPQPFPEATLDQARDRVVADLTADRASKLAEKAAADFAYTLFDQKIDYNTDAFTHYIAAEKLALKSAGAVDPENPPPGLGWGAQALQEIATLSEKRPVSNPLRIGGNAIVAFFDERIPEAEPVFALVRERVLADVRADAKRRATVAHGTDLRAIITAALKAGKSFADAAKDLNLDTKAWENFTLRALPADFDYGIYQTLRELPLNQVSDLVVQGERGLFVIVTAKKVPEIASDSPEFAKARLDAAKVASQVTANGILASVVEAELSAKGLLSEKAP